MKVFEKNIFVLFTQICLRAPAAHPNPLKAIKLLNNEKTKLFDLHYIRSQQSCCLIFATWWNHSQILSFWSLNSLIVLTSNDIFCVSWKLVFVNKISVNLLNSKPALSNLGIVKIDSRTRSFCLRQYVQTVYLQYWINFINILRALFLRVLYESALHSFSLLHFGL